MWALVVLALVCAARAAVIAPHYDPAQILVGVPAAYAGPQEEQDQPLVYLRDLSSEPQFAFQGQPRYDKFGECNHGSPGGYPPQRQPCPYRKWPCDPYYYY